MSIVSTQPEAMVSPQTLLAFCKATADQLRLDVLRVLKVESFSVGELCTILGAAQPAMSHHLKILLTAGLVARRREGNSLFYRRATPSSARVSSTRGRPTDDRLVQPQ